MNKVLYSQIYCALVCLILLGCGASSGIISTPVENIDSSPLKVTELTEDELQKWSHLDLEKDTIPGMSVDKAYSELIKKKKEKRLLWL